MARIDVDLIDEVCNDVHAGRRDWPTEWLTVRPRFDVYRTQLGDMPEDTPLEPNGGNKEDAPHRMISGASDAQLDLIRSLLDRLPADHEGHAVDLDKLSKKAATKLIDRLKLDVPNLASENQINWIKSLIEARDTSAFGVDLDMILATDITRDAASNLIDLLKACPWKPVPVAAPADDEFTALAEECLKLAGQHGARFAVHTEDGADNELAFWVVKRGRNDRIYLNQFIGGQGPVHVRMSKPAQVAVLRKIHAAGVEASAVLFGQELGQCYRCALPLTNDRTRAAGIGDDCAGQV